MDEPSVVEGRFTVVSGAAGEELEPHQKRLLWVAIQAMKVARFAKSDEWHSRKRDVRWFLWGVIGLAMLGSLLAGLHGH